MVNVSVIFWWQRAIKILAKHSTEILFAALTDLLAGYELGKYCRSNSLILCRKSHSYALQDQFAIASCFTLALFDLHIRLPSLSMALETVTGSH